MSQSDGELVKAILAGDRSSFERLYDKYARLVRSVCYDTTGDLTQAQDIAQEVFLRAYQKLDRLSNPDLFAPWLVSIARNVCREYRRGKYRDRLVLVGLETPEVPTDPPDEDAGLEGELAEAMKKLTEQERLAIHVHYLQELDIQEAIAILKTSRSGFYRLLEKARKKLEKLLT